MLKQIPKSDITLRPFKVYKNFTFTNLDTGSIIEASIALNHTGSINVLNVSQSAENGLWHQLKTMYYNTYNVDNTLNPFISYGEFKPRFHKTEKGKQRRLNDRTLVLKIPQIKFGEGIKKNSVLLSLGATEETIIDDGYSNLISDRNTFKLIEFNVQNEFIIFEDAEDTSFTLNLWALGSGYSIDMNTGIIYFEDETLPFTNLIVDVTNEIITFTGLIKSIPQLVLENVGNAFYSHGIITLTKDTAIGEEKENALNDFELNYQSTKTIYENEFLLVVEEDEFNVSTNPTAVNFVNLKTGSISTTYEGEIKTVSYDSATIKENYFSQQTYLSGSTLYGQQISSSVMVSGSVGFSDYEYSSSIDPTGSYLAPYITTIGLYDDQLNMVAVAKLATPIKSMPDLPVNFLIRIDT